MNEEYTGSAGSTAGSTGNGDSAKSASSTSTFADTDLMDSPSSSNATQEPMGASNGTSNGASNGASSGETPPVVTQVREAVAPAVQQAQQKTGELLSQAQQQAVSRIDQQKVNAVGGLGAVAETLRQTGQQLRENDQGVITQYVSQYSETAANQVEKVSGYLNERDVNQLIGEVESFARREPTLFIAGAFLLGIASARFLRASAPTGATLGTDSSTALATPNLTNTSWDGS